MKIEITPEMEEWYERADKDGSFLLKEGSSILYEAMRKAKNKIQVGNLVKSIEESRIIFFTCNRIEGPFFYDYYGNSYVYDYCTRATKEEEAFIRPLLEK